MRARGAQKKLKNGIKTEAEIFCKAALKAA
jgi:hypothetical protein